MRIEFIDTSMDQINSASIQAYDHPMRNAASKVGRSTNHRTLTRPSVARSGQPIAVRLSTTSGQSTTKAFFQVQAAQSEITREQDEIRKLEIGSDKRKDRNTGEEEVSGGESWSIRKCLEYMVKGGTCARAAL